MGRKSVCVLCACVCVFVCLYAYVDAKRTEIKITMQIEYIRTHPWGNTEWEFINVYEYLPAFSFRIIIICKMHISPFSLRNQMVFLSARCVETGWLAGRPATTTETAQQFSALFFFLSYICCGGCIGGLRIIQMCDARPSILQTWPHKQCYRARDISYTAIAYQEYV